MIILQCTPHRFSALLAATVLSTLFFPGPYHVHAQFTLPSSFINPLIGTTGPEPGQSGGMVPSVAPPFGSCKWVVQNQQNWVSRTSFNFTDDYKVYGFIGSRQPAIWMGESAWAGVVPGSGDKIKTGWDERGMNRVKGSEEFGVGFYGVELEQEKGKIKVEMSATSRVGHFRFTFTDTEQPYIFVPVTRQSTLFHTPNIFNHSYFPTGTVEITESGGQNRSLEICGSNDELQDQLLAPTSIAENAKNFKGFICARFSAHSSYGITSGNTTEENAVSGSGRELGAFVRFKATPHASTVVDVRIGTSLISTDQARWNIDNEVPEGDEVEATRKKTEAKWAEKIGRFEIDTDDEEGKAVFLTAVSRATQFPYEVHDPTSGGVSRYYSAYDNAIHEGDSYNGYSIWDTYRAAWSFQLLFAPERIPGMVRSMLHDFKEGGWLPMWKNIVETNIMVSTHSDSLLAEAIRKGFLSAFTDGELTTMWEAVWKDASIPPVNDENTVYSDRQEGVDFEARAGLTTYMNKSMGWVAVDVHSESVSRTLDYAYDDHVLSILSSLLPNHITATTNTNVNLTQFLDTRARRNAWIVWNNSTGFVQARFRNGSFDPDTAAGFTEGSRGVYSLSQGLVWGDSIHDLVERRGGISGFVDSLDDYFNGPEVDFRNEPAHHTPYLYALASPAHARSTQSLVRELAKANFNNTPQGLSGNDDCGQTSSWYIFSAMGFYSVDPASGEYVLGSPFFSKMTVHIPKSLVHGNEDPHGAYNSKTDSYVLQISAKGAEKKWHVEDVRVNGVSKKDTMRIQHEDIIWGGVIEFDMTD
ncbi:hypothetical protein E1B28_005637 [Marasmius oreades]|uniref:Glycoside hydrolase family 92 protein n=1 Tax=Marasmius oreades TaxID=181124 RepID=A0A9P7S3J5_9AGAR|nr:uncharacterized protein E1B28_005637 [Marasmius oreades]KAG7094824.1 hypothetical protein E1B28_005637 [Marasmius oreades]